MLRKIKRRDFIFPSRLCNIGYKRIRELAYHRSLGYKSTLFSALRNVEKVKNSYMFTFDTYSTPEGGDYWNKVFLDVVNRKKSKKLPRYVKKSSHLLSWKRLNEYLQRQDKEFSHRLR